MTASTEATSDPESIPAHGTPATPGRRGRGLPRPGTRAFDRRGARRAGPSPSTAPGAPTRVRTSATTAWSPSSWDDPQGTRWSSMPTRPEPSASSSAPAWCPASGTRPGPAASRDRRIHPPERPAGREICGGAPPAVRRWGVATTVSIRPSAATLDRRRRLGADVVRIGTDAGLAAVGIGGAEVFTTTRSTLYARRRAGLHGGMQFTYRNPDRSTDPARVVDGARSLVVGAWDYRRRDPDDRAGPDRTPGAPGRGRRPLRPPGPLRVAARRPRAGRRPTAGRRVAGARRRGRERPGRPGSRPAGRPRMVRTQLAPPPARARLVVRARLRGDRRPPRAHPAGGALGSGRGMRFVPAVRDDVPDRGTGGRRRAGRTAVPGLAGPGSGPVPGGAPGRPRRAHLRLRRVPGGVPGQQGGRPPPAPVRARGRHGCHRRPADTPGGHRRGAARHERPVVPGRARPPIPAPQRPGGAGERGGLPGPGDGGDPRPLGRIRRRAAGRARPVGQRAAGARRTLRSRPRDPPARHQRLPAQGRRHPGLPVGAVAAAGPLHVRRADGLVPPGRGRLRRRTGDPGHPDRAGAVPGARAHARSWSDASGPRPSGSAPTWSCSTPPSRSAWWAPDSASPTPCCSTGPRWRSPGACP